MRRYKTSLILVILNLILAMAFALTISNLGLDFFSDSQAWAINDGTDLQVVKFDRHGYQNNNEIEYMFDFGDTGNATTYSIDDKRVLSPSFIFYDLKQDATNINFSEIDVFSSNEDTINISFDENDDYLRIFAQPLQIDTYTIQVQQNENTISEIQINVSDEKQAVPVADNDFVMLNNHQKNNDLKESVYIGFGVTGYSLTFLNVTAKLNDQTIDVDDYIQDASNFEQILDLEKNIYSHDTGEPIHQLDGHYSYTFEYNYIDNFGNTSDRQERTVEFHLLDGSFYSNDSSIDMGDFIEPKIYNTEKILPSEQNDLSFEKNFFNYNNNNTLELSDPYFYNEPYVNLKLPKIVFDASRYSMSYTRVADGNIYTIHSSFELIDSDNGIISYYKNGKQTPFETKTIDVSNDNNFITSHRLENLGDYEFSFSYLFSTRDGANKFTEYQSSFTNATTDKIYVESNRTNQVNLYNFGHQLYYSVGETDYSIFEDRNSDLLTDYTFKLDTDAYSNIVDTISDKLSPSDAPIDLGSVDIASTSMAPVFAKRHSSLIYTTNNLVSKSYFRHSNTNDFSGSSPQEYRNNTRFSKSGFYEFVVAYNFNRYMKETSGGDVVNASSTHHVQVFYFEVSNLPPSLLIEESESSTQISNNGHTNQDVLIKAIPRQDFDVDPIIIVNSQTFDGSNILTNFEIENFPQTFSQNGYYKVKMYFGPGHSSYIKRNFNIDKTPIANLEIFSVHDDNQIESSLFGISNNDFIILDSPFILDWAKKESGAQVSAKYSFSNLSQTSSVSSIVDHQEFLPITTKNKLQNYYLNLTYPKGVIDDNVSPGAVLKEPSLYNFIVFDEAGNEVEFSILLDNSTPGIIQTPEQLSSNPQNFMPEKTTLTWGTHKAVEISNLVYNDLPEHIKSSPKVYYDEVNNSYFVLIELEKIEIYSTALDNSGEMGRADDIQNNTPPSNLLIASYNTASGDWEDGITFYISTTGDSIDEDVPAGTPDYLRGEKIYYTYIQDKSQTASNSNIKYLNTLFHQLRINLDRSLGQAHTRGTVKSGSASNEYLFLDRGQSSNRQYLYFEFIDDDGDYEIEQLYYQYYPLNFDTNSPNYPFSETHSKQADLLAGATLKDDDSYRTKPINVNFSTKYNTTLTAPGKYLITRIYSGDESVFAGDGDSKQQEYTFIIDRNDPIERLSAFDNLIVGSEIKLLLGTSRDNPLDYDEFLIDFGFDTNLFSTNLLPIGLHIPINKYVYFDNGTIIPSQFAAFNLNVEITHSQNLDWRMSSNFNNTQNNLFLFDEELYMPGTYYVSITDTSELESGNPNSIEFSFIVDRSIPQGRFISSENEQYVSLENASSTGRETLSYSWVESVNPYNANIDPKNFSIDFIERGESSPTRIFSIEDGDKIINPYSLELKINELPDGRLEYIVDIFDKTSPVKGGSPLSSIEGEYIANIQFEGEEEYYSYEEESFFSNSQSIMIDKTPPSYTLNRLLGLDNYLDDINIEDFYDRNSHYNFENYPFAVGGEFELRRIPSSEYPAYNISSFEQETFDIFYRAYDKYEDGASNMQSLVPGDPYFNDLDAAPNRLRFDRADSAYTKIPYSSTSIEERSGLSGLNTFEIIEVDEAGNHRVFTIQLVTSSPSISYVLPGAENGETDQNIKFIYSNDSLNPEIINDLSLLIHDIDIEDLFFVVEMANITNPNNVVSTIFSHDMHTDTYQFISSLNEFISSDSNQNGMGQSFSVHLTDRLRNSVSFIFNAQGEKLAPEFTEFSNYFNVQMPENLPHTRIVEFKAMTLIEGSLTTLSNDIDGFPISIQEDSDGLEEFRFGPGEYYFEFKDNFDRNYIIQYIFGIEDIASVHFESYQYVDGTHYTAQDVSIEYQPYIYSLYVYKNGELYFSIPSNEIIPGSGDIYTGDYFIQENSSTSTYLIELIGISQNKGLNDEYEVVFSRGLDGIFEDLDDIDNEVRIDFGVVTKFPEIEINDGAGNNLQLIEEDSTPSTAQTIFIDYTSSEIDISEELYKSLGYKIDLIYTLGDQTDLIQSIESGATFSSPGDYELKITNNIGLNMSYNFQIIDLTISTYAVVTNTHLISPTHLSYINQRYMPDPEVFATTQGIRWYITNEDHYEISLNTDRGLDYVNVGSDHNEMTTIYQIFSQGQDSPQYDRFIAVSKIPSTNNILENATSIDEARNNLIGYDANNVKTLTWTDYFKINANTIYIDYYFNSSYVGRISDTNEIQFYDSGIYDFEFRDLAGNQHIFGGIPRLTIEYINDITYRVNNNEPIPNAVYNNEVNISITNRNAYDARSLSTSVKKNGQNYSLDGTSIDNYNFVEFGVYEVKMSATIDEEPITTLYTFRIINEKQSRISFEYNLPNNYKLVAIRKDNVDISTAFKNNMFNNNHSRIFVSPASFGNGNYYIEVKANYYGLRPSQTFGFNVWINEETPIILSSLSPGDSTTRNITLSFNKYLIYQQIGESYIYINDQRIEINESSASVSEITDYEISRDGKYFVQLRTPTNDTLISFAITKRPPLNTTAMFLIIAGSLVLIVITFVFIRLRTKMRVS